MPPASAAASKAAPARRHVRAPGAGAPARRAPLRVVPARRRGTRSAQQPGRLARLFQGNRLFTVLAVILVVGSLIAVVVGQAMLANGQVRLASLQHQLSLEQSTHRQAELSVSELETPSRIVATATGQLHMVRPAQVIELPYVSLSSPLSTPKVTPAPAVAPSTSPTSSASTGATGSAGTSGSGSAAGATSTSSGAATTGSTSAGSTSSTTTPTSTP
jgi:cell division protein FtsL